MSLENTPSLFDRTVANLVGAWRSLLGGRTNPLSLRPDLRTADARLLREQMADCLAARGGEASARTRAALLGHAYLGLNETGRRRFLEILGQEFDADPAAVDALCQRLLASEPDDRPDIQRELRSVLIAPRVKLLTQFNSLPRGVKFLVDLRADLLKFTKINNQLKPLEQDLHELLASWFDVGFLSLKRIDWDAPASLLEKLIDYEAVHAITSWNDLKNRLQSDRRCYAFFHPRMPDEPLIFIQVALTRSMSNNIKALLDEQAPTADAEEANSAIFYSISNTQAGLAGIQFGSFLIKRVVDDLQRDFPKLRTFATLSPIPGFRRWLARLDAEQWQLSKSEQATLAELKVNEHTLEQSEWHNNEPISDALRTPLMRLCAQYLLHASKHGRALDPVAHFHLTNGARIERLNWLADDSAKGIEQSAGLMVNYLYDLNDIEKNHEAYRGQHERQASSSVRNLAK